MSLQFETRAPYAAILALALVTPLIIPTASASTRIELNGQWQFRTDPSKQGEQEGWYKQIPAATETVRVPHTWGIGKYDDFEGTAWYFRTFALSQENLAKHIELHFAATFYKSRVWLNGVELGGHEGGHTEYWFDATPYLRRTNFVAVELNNQPDTATIPGWAMKLHSSQNIWYDWWHYGGIVRDVWLSVNDAVLIRRQFIRTKVEGGAASVSDHVLLESTSRKPLEGKLVLKAWSPEGGPTPAATAEQSVKLTSATTQDLTLTLKIDTVKLWHFDDPEVYRLEADLLDAKGKEFDSITDNFGVRTVELRDRKLWLNGEPVRLTGMARHEESPWAGLAETTDTIVHDYDDMKNLQMTLTRPVHYPQHPTVLDYCDRHGILLIPEIPVWQFSEKQMSDPKVMELAKHMLTEMIEQAGNHPSIFAWSVCNESATDTPGGRAYFKTMYDLIKSLDPDRYVTYADDRIAFVENPQENSASLADFIMWNEYFGAWHGPETLLPQVFERIRKNYPDKAVIVSEFGTPGVFATDTRAADRLRVHTFRHQTGEFGKQDWIAGAIMWCYQDYKSHRNLWPGYTEGYVDHGVVDEYRQRRPSYEVWRELNAPARVQVEWKFGPGRSSLPMGFKATIERRRTDEIPSYTLRNYRVVWELRDDDGSKLSDGQQTLPEIGPPQSIDSDWLPQKTKSLHLKLWLYRPTGFVAVDKKLDWLEPRSGGLNLEEMKKEGMKIPE
jgi:beta-glucuronidase